MKLIKSINHSAKVGTKFALLVHEMNESPCFGAKIIQYWSFIVLFVQYTA